ncbi:MAG: peptidoglycan-associated lipoprotein Pal [Chromatiales bacterium]
MQKRWLQILVLIVAASLAFGCARNTKEEGAAAVDDKSQGLTPEEMAAQTQGAADSEGLEGSALEGAGAVGSDRIIYFDYDSSEVRAEYRPIIEAAASHLAANRNASVSLEGHADERGSREYNLALGERRAQTVQRQMVLLGASASQIRTISYGEERPADPGHDETAYSQNRRVQVIY